jgi:hypothetical protein
VVLTWRDGRARPAKAAAHHPHRRRWFFGFGEHDGPQLDNFEGRFAQMLPRKRPTAEARELARAMLAAMGISKDALRGNAERNWSVWFRCLRKTARRWLKFIRECLHELRSHLPVRRAADSMRARTA